MSRGRSSSILPPLGGLPSSGKMNCWMAPPTCDDVSRAEARTAQRLAVTALRASHGVAAAERPAAAAAAASAAPPEKAAALGVGCTT
jgi:hypothetical protein